MEISHAVRLPYLPERLQDKLLQVFIATHLLQIARPLPSDFLDLLLHLDLASKIHRSNPIHHFSEKELLIATNYYDRQQMFLDFDGYGLYKGSLNDLPIIVKKYEYLHPRFSLYKDIVIGSQMSVHKNVLKVLGCCLETEKPSVVYEFAGTESLSPRISATNDQLLQWKSRLKIAVDLANAIMYLHTAFPRPIIHRHIKCSKILLDQNNVPKLADFVLCIEIPEGQSHVENDLTGRAWFLAPEYWEKSYLTEKADVYQFGMLLLQLLSGRDPIYAILEHNLRDHKKPHVKNFINVVDQRIKHEGTEERQLLDFATLVLRCISFDEEERPTMMEVAKELRRIHQSFPSP